MQKKGEVHATIEEITGWVDSFLIDCQVRELSPNTIRYYRDNLEKFIQYCQQEGIHTLETLTPVIFRRFLLWLKSEGHNPGGIHAHYRICKTFIRWWVVETEPRAYHNIFKKVGAPSLPKIILPPVPFDDIQAMLETCGKDFHGLRDIAILLCLLDTGARAAEFLALDVEDTNMRTGGVYIANGKGGKSRTVFIGKAARRALRRYLGPRNHGPLWTGRNHERLSYSGIRKMLIKRAKLAGVDTPSPHAFRRSFAVNSLRAGMDLETLRRLLGHTDYQVITRYLDLLDGDLQAAHARTSPADRLQKRR